MTVILARGTRKVGQVNLGAAGGSLGSMAADIQPGDIVFFDDIGENLKMGKNAGWRTVKVWLGKTSETVKELEEITGEVFTDDTRAKL